MTHTLDIHNCLEFAKEITQEAGKYILEVLAGEKIRVEFKTSSTDLVTQVDQEVERRLVRRINEAYPEHTILGEEGITKVAEDADYTWIIDPIDGTTNFVHQQINFCISVGVYKGNEGLIGVIYDPARQEMFWAAKGMGAFLNGKKIELSGKHTLQESLIGTNLLWVRRTRKWGLERHIQEIALNCRGIRALGAAALELAYVAAGRLDGFLSLHLSPWDFAASKVIIEEAGGKVTDFKGEEIKISKDKYGIIGSHPDVYPEMLAILKKHS